MGNSRWLIAYENVLFLALPRFPGKDHCNSNEFYYKMYKIAPRTQIKRIRFFTIIGMKSFLMPWCIKCSIGAHVIYIYYYVEQKLSVELYW